MAKARSMKPNSSKNKRSAVKAKVNGTVSSPKVKQSKRKPANWAKVKIAGNLISDDGGGFEGLIGLEVLEDYNDACISTKKVKLPFSKLSKKEISPKIVKKKKENSNQ